MNQRGPFDLPHYATVKKTDRREKAKLVNETSESDSSIEIRDNDYHQYERCSCRAEVSPDCQLGADILSSYSYSQDDD